MEPTDVTGVQRDHVATSALTAFLDRDFARADQALNSLASLLSSEGTETDHSTFKPRITHNLLVSKFYHETTQENIDTFISFLLEPLPKEQRPSSTKDFFVWIADNRDALKTLYSVVGPVGLFNAAVIAYHTGYATAAACIGELLYARIEAKDDWLALRICFLLIDVHLRLGNVSSGTIMASYAEKVLNNSANADKKGFPTTLDLKVLTPEWRGRSNGILQVPTSYDDARFCLRMYKARLDMDSENTTENGSMRHEPKHALLTSDDSERHPNAGVLLVKARVEQNYAESFRILASILTQCAPSMAKKVRPLILNTLGVLHHRLGRHALAACYFEHSRKAFDTMTESEDSSSDSSLLLLNVLDDAKDTRVSYNLALQYMRLGDYGRALDLFGICASKDPTFAKDSAFLWLRMAECCVGIESNANARQGITVQGHGRGRRIVMQPTKRVDKRLMQYGVTCARAAIAILDRRSSATDHSEGSKAKKTTRSASTGGRQSRLEQTARSNVPFSREDLRVRAAALSLIAYMSLAFDPNAVIEATDELLKTHAASESDRCELARLYSAEAYCMLGRYEDAANRIAPLLPSDSTTDSSTREMAHVNMALMHISKGDLEAGSRAAKLALKTFAAQPKRSKLLQRETIFATSYIFLRNGEVEIARRCLRMLLNGIE